ncbi:hypothetical protein GCM10010201_28170 [Pilimelia columellifera subsp. columellifera]|uniref:Uncharacterized protein n=1 Tax=Pilimelia columellifera subsp. columellifera TaxID=706583 RepID=A0ABP6AXX8_9ACTN
MALGGAWYLWAAVIATSDDPRAYPGSRGDRTLEQTLRAFQLTLPPCATDVRFLAKRPWPMSDWRHLLIRLVAPDRSCLDSFVSTNSLDATGVVDGKELENDREREVESVNWHYRSGVAYQTFDSGTSSNEPGNRYLQACDVQVEQQGRSFVVYTHCFRWVPQ